VFRRAENARVKGLLRTVVLTSAALLATAAVPLAHDAIRGPLTLVLGIASLVLLLLKQIDRLWVIVGAATLSLLASFVPRWSYWSTPRSTFSGSSAIYHAILNTVRFDPFLGPQYYLQLPGPLLLSRRSTSRRKRSRLANA
jgi:chromate transport protein ChrA